MRPNLQILYWFNLDHISGWNFFPATQIVYSYSSLSLANWLLIDMMFRIRRASSALAPGYTDEAINIYGELVFFTSSWCVH